ncbi:MAG TPA: hypothetical protein VIM70_09700 [Clostridium sp.]|uniref:hypothetical protein n=1 Tax=Clostridium sp. TaxID=1506 RepID=UPI002F93350A
MSEANLLLARALREPLLAFFHSLSISKRFSSVYFTFKKITPSIDNYNTLSNKRGAVQSRQIK